MNFAELFREPTEVERKYRKFLESKAKEFDSIIPREITEEYVSYDLTQFKTIDEKVDFLSVFLNSEELYGPYPKKCIEHFFKKEYSEIKYFFYNIEEKGKEYLEISEYGEHFGFDEVKVDIRVYENRIDFRLQQFSKDECDYYNDDYDNDYEEDYDMCGLLYQRTYGK